MSMELYFAPSQEFQGKLEVGEVVLVQVDMVVGLQGPPGSIGNLSEAISQDAHNRLALGADSKLFVEDGLTPDPLMYYILAKG